jgi:signal peptidase I
MEPTLLGDVNRDHPIDGSNGCPFRDDHFPGGGDRIMVTKYYYDFSDIERFDVVVFKFPLNQAKNFIKRVVGLPNEELKIWQGDLYARPKGGEKFAIVRRPLRIQDSIWISAAGAGRLLRDAQTFQNHWDALPSSGTRSAQHTLIDEELSTQEVGGERGVKFLFTPPINDGQGAVGDVHVAFDFELTSPRGRLFAEVTNSHGTFELSLETDGESQLRAYAPDSGKSQPTRRVALKNNFHPVMDRRYKLDLAVYDGMAVARINGEVLADLTFLAFREDETREKEFGNTLISFGSREVTFKARNLKIGRDIYYRPARSSYDYGLKEDTAVEIPNGQYLMMGDNVANSHDSRAWVETVFKLKDGREIVCESQEINKHEAQMRLKEKLGLDHLPDYVIDADRHGNEIFFSQKDIEGGSPTKREFRFVDRKYIVGKGLWIWWPQGRWFHLIR